MSTRFFLLLALLALFVPQMLSTAAQAPPSAAATTQQADVGTIQGIVVREGTGEPIPDVQIMLAGPNASPTPDALLNTLASLLATLPPDQALAVEGIARGGLPGQVVSDSEGRFTIQKAPAGPRTVRARREGYFAPLANGTYPADAIVPVTVKANETSNVRVVLVPGASVSGRVLDPAGRPLADAMIQIQRAAYVNGAPSLEIVSAGRTDDRGEYRLYRLAPGDYYISASPRPQIALAGPAKVDPNLREVPTTTFYPNTTDADSAQRVGLGPGGEMTGVNIQMRTTSAVKISGRVVSAIMTGATIERGQPRVGAVFLVPRDTRDPLLSLGLPGLSNTVPVGVEGGDFEFQGVTPGTYDIIARLSAANGNGWGPYNTPQTATHAWAFGRATVDVRGGDLADVTVVVRPGVDIKGRVLLDGKTLRANARITLNPDDAFQNIGDSQAMLVMNQIAQYAAPIADDGTFVIPLVPEGRYRFLITLNPTATPAGRRGAGAGAAAAAPAAPPLPTGTHVADIRQGSTSVYDNGLVVGSDAANPLDILLSTAQGSVEGSVIGADQKPASRVTVVLIPPEQRRQNSALYKTMLSGIDGRYVFNNVPAGNYTVYAWESVPARAYQNAEFLARFAGRGKPVTIQAGAPATADVNVIPKDAGR